MTAQTAADDCQSMPVPPPRLWPGLAVGLALLAAAGLVFHRTWTMARDGAALQAVRTASAAAAAMERTRAEEAWAAANDLRRRMSGFLSQDARPALAVAREKDLEALDRAVRSLDACFDRYAGGVDRFTGELTGWGTRFRLIWRKGVETAKQREIPEGTAKLVRDKFESCVVSDARLEADVMAVMRQFAYDLEANRNELLGTLKTRLAASSLPVEVRKVAMQEFQTQFQQNLTRLLKELPSHTVGVGVGSLTAGIVAEEAVRQLVRIVLTQAAARLAGSAMASGGAAATAVAAGGTGGTVVAPGVGTAIGVAGGFVVGAVVDWWMTDKFEAQVKTDVLTFLRATRNALVGGPQGIESLLKAQVDQASSAWERAVTGSLQASLHPPP
ncbi:MAG: hypothetical protein JWM59_679 [Verrucomicrobiales bacterium]|nr:hypothetical protein [Verrucomicrobiales bacterium]